MPSLAKENLPLTTIYRHGHRYRQQHYQHHDINGHLLRPIYTFISRIYVAMIALVSTAPKKPPPLLSPTSTATYY